VSLFAENPFFFQRFTIRSRGALQFDADPQSFTANFLQVGAAQSLQQAEKVGPKLRGTLDKLLFYQYTQSRTGNGTTERIAAERAAMVS